MVTQMTVSTDAQDYAPGSWAEITATGFEPGSTVTFQVQHAGDPGADGLWGTLDDVIVDLGGDGHEAWSVTDGSALDLDGTANGTVVTSWYVNPDDSLNWHFLLTAMAAGQETASEGFTDSLPSAASVDLTVSGNTGVINGALFSNVQYGAGSGLINPFVRIQNSGTEQGYNSSANLAQQFDETGRYNSTYNKVLLLSALPTVYVYNEDTGEFSSYKQLLLDITEKQGGGQEYLSLDALQIYQSGSGTLSGFTGSYNSTGSFSGGSSSLVYNLDADGDHWVALNASLNSGSGVGDIAVYIPESVFNEGSYVYVYSAFGHQATSAGYLWDSGGGFEEWSVGKEMPLSVSKITGSKFIDADKDGVKDTGELPQAGVRIYLDQDQDGNLDWVDTDADNAWDAGEGERWTTTDANGAYVFDNLAAGLGVNSTYYVREVVPTGYTQTGPLNGTYSVGVGSETATVSGGVITVNIASADSVYMLPAFGNHLNFVPMPSLSLTKSAVVEDGAADEKDDVITYTVVVSNTGNVTLSGIKLTDLFEGSELTTISESFDLAVGGSKEFVYAHTVTQAELDSQGGGDTKLSNEATAVVGVLKASDTAEVPLGYDPKIDINKITISGSKSGDGITVNAGDAVTWKYTVTNTGNVTLSNVALVDDNGPFSDITPVYKSGDQNTNGKLDVGEEWIYEASGTAISGSYTNTATVTAQTQTGDGVKDLDSSSYTGQSKSTALIAPTNTTINQYLEGTAQTFQSAYSSQGGVIQYNVSLKNGQITQTNPGVLFYFTGASGSIKVAAGNPTEQLSVTIDQTVTLKTGSPITTPLSAVKNNYQVYQVVDANQNGKYDLGETINSISSTYQPDTNGDITLQFTGTSGSFYVISVKYDTSSVKNTLVGKASDLWPTVNYTFDTVFRGSKVETYAGGVDLAAKKSTAMLLEGDEGAGSKAVNDAQIKHVINAAICWWEDQGITAEQLTQLKASTVEIADLGENDQGWMLGASSGSLISIDDDAADHGWSLGLGDVAHHKVDLFSVLVHEMGHVLGKTDEEMGATLAVGERMLPMLSVTPPDDDDDQDTVENQLLDVPGEDHSDGHAPDRGDGDDHGMPTAEHMLTLLGTHAAAAVEQMQLHMG